MQIAAPAKINLTLEVLDRRDDGYHALRSVMVPLDLCDTLTILDAEKFAFRCDDASLQNDDNLVVRAVRAAAPNAKRSISLHKVIPSQAGLGGGSSDAASTLLAAMNGAFGEIEQRDWVEVARKLGSDVPFFLAQSGALVEGTGERVTAVGDLPTWHVVVVKPPCAVSTAAAFKELDGRPRPSRARSTSVSLETLDALQRGDYGDVMHGLSNDFHEVIAAQHDDVASAIDALRTAGATKPLLSGSGSAVYALEQSAQKADAVMKALTIGSDFRVFRAMLRNSGAWRS